MVGNEAANQAAQQAAAPVATQPGFLARIKEMLNPSNLIEKIKESRSTLTDIALYGGFGFLTGFFLRKYSNYVALIILMIVGVVVLQQLEVISITINWVKVNELFGIQPGNATVADTGLTVFWEWVKANLVIVVSYVIGFLIGLRVG